MHQKFKVTGMTCSACSQTVEKSVRKLSAVKTVGVNLLSNTMVVDYDENEIRDADILKAVSDAGYTASLADTGASHKTPVEDPIKANLKSMKKRLIVSVIFWLPLMYLAMYHMLSMWTKLPTPTFIHDAFSGVENAGSYIFTQFLLVLPIIFVNWNYFRNGFKSLWKRTPNMDSLIAIGSTASMLYGIYALYRIVYGLGWNDPTTVSHFLEDIYIESAGTILTLITLGKYLEARSKGKTSDAISKLMDLAPKTAIVERGQEEIEVSLEDVQVGDIVIVRPGQSIAVDGVILEGNTSVDQSALTGESMPVEKHLGDKVIGASINKTGFIKFRAEKVGEDTTLSQIIQLVEDANTSKAPIAKTADKISGIFVPIVMVIAIVSVIVWLLLGYSFEFALSIGIAVLVISCPCALGLATPVAIMVGTGKGASHGILYKSAEALEIAQTVKTVVLDKTGTITEGKPRVTDVFPSGDLSHSEFLRIAATLEKPSEHPLSEAVVNFAQDQNIPVDTVTSFTSLPGRGILVNMQNDNYYAGNLALMQENQVVLGNFTSIGEAMSEQAKTPLYFAKGEKCLGLIAVADTVKPTSRQAVEELKAMSIDVVMLTGDNQKTATAIQKTVGIDQVISDVMPQDKEQVIRKLQESGKKVAMIGDGINDAPALARADVGIAIGAGTDIAIESADIVLMKSDLLDAVTAIQLSRKAIRNIRQNLFWAFFYNSIGIPLAAGVFYLLLGWKLSPMFASAAMSLSSVCVVLNALRLRFFKPHWKSSDKTTKLSNVSDSSHPANNKTLSEAGNSLDVMGKSSVMDNTSVSKNPQFSDDISSPFSGVDNALQKTDIADNFTDVNTDPLKSSDNPLGDLERTMQPNERSRNLKSGHSLDAADNNSVKSILQQSHLRLNTNNKELRNEEIMKKTMYIEGMTCAHCKARVEKVLCEIDGVKAEVDLERKCANIELTQTVDDTTLKAVVENAGYEVISII